MSSTASKALCGSSRKLLARRTRAYSSSALVSSTATIATICWASTSSGLRSSATSSIAPWRIRSTTTADSTRSPRWLGKKTPRDVAPTWCPARPTRCSPLATDGGASTCTTTSTAPMSMPSSSDDVATTQGSWPDFRSFSIWARCSLLTDPWCARAITGDVVPSRPVEAPDWAMISAGGANSAVSSPSRSACSSLRWAVSRSASRRELANTMVDRCALMTSRIRFSTCGQIDGVRGGGWSSSRLGGGVVGVDALAARSLMSSTGTTIDRSHAFSAGGATTRTG